MTVARQETVATLSLLTRMRATRIGFLLFLLLLPSTETTRRGRRQFSSAFLKVSALNMFFAVGGKAVVISRANDKESAFYVKINQKTPKQKQQRSTQLAFNSLQ
jgi:hypothetical protein